MYIYGIPYARMEEVDEQCERRRGAERERKETIPEIHFDWMNVNIYSMCMTMMMLIMMMAVARWANQIKRVHEK